MYPETKASREQTAGALVADLSALVARAHKLSQATAALREAHFGPAPHGASGDEKTSPPSGFLPECFDRVRILNELLAIIENDVDAVARSHGLDEVRPPSVATSAGRY